MKNPNQLPPFAPTDLRAWIEGTEAEKNIVGTIRLLQWIEGPEAELVLPLILAAMPDVSERQVKRNLAKVKAHGWLLTKRQAKGRLGRGGTVYALCIPPMSFSEARNIIKLRANLAPRSSEATGQMELTKGPKEADLGATVAPPNIKEKDLRERQREETSLKASPPTPRAEILMAFRSWWKTTFPALKYIQGPGDGKVADALLASEITPADLLRLLPHWQGCASRFVQEAGYPLRLVPGDLTRMQMAVKTTPKKWACPKCGTSSNRVNHTGLCLTCTDNRKDAHA